MSKTALKNKITASLEEMDVDQLKSAYLLIKELLATQKKKITSADTTIIDQKIALGIKQLDDGEGRDFGLVLNDLQARYGKK